LNQTGFSQQTFDVAELRNGQIELTMSQLVLSKAFSWTFRDGTKVTDLKVEQLNNQYFLVAYCIYQQYTRQVGINLDFVGNKFYINDESTFKICSAVSCKTCRFFIEHMRIIGCKCEETGTVSNHCHYKVVPIGIFMQNINRALMLSKEKEE
jgi:hypothetical protein